MIEARILGQFDLLYEPQNNKLSRKGEIMPNDELKELYIDELRDLYNAENQLVKALPKMAKAASSDELRQGFEEHLEQTKANTQGWEKFFRLWVRAPKGRSAREWKGLSRRDLKRWKRTTKAMLRTPR